MRWVFALALSLVCGAGMTAVAQNVSRLYPREKLEADAARWGDQIRAEYRETILPQLTASERAALSATKIEIPLLGHYGDPVQKRKQEIEADQFAIEVMRRIGQMPLGIEFWFDVEHFRHVASTKVPTEAEWQKHLAALDHPVTTERLEALAVTIEKAADSFARNQTNQALWTQRTKMLAEAFRRMAPLVNPVADMAEYSRVKKLYVADLKPRKAAFTMPGSEHEPEFNGLFAVRRTAANGAQDTVDLLLLRSGDDQVMGGYMNGKVDGFIQGDIKDGVLKFTWREGSATGHGIARSQGETLRGTWGTDEADQGGGEWVGVRVKRDTTR